MAQDRREIRGLALREAAEPHLLTALWRWAEREPDRPLLASRQGDAFVEQRATDVRDTIREVAGGLVARGIAPGDRVALLARTSLAWVQADHGILAAGAISVPIYDTSSPAQIERIVQDSGARLVLVETSEQATDVRTRLSDAADEPEVLVLDEGALDGLREDGRGHLDEVDRRVAALSGEDLAALIYSSGTTGSPKGCQLTHANLTTNARQTAEQVPELFGGEARTLIFLPLAHALARMQLHTAIQEGALIGFATGIDQLAEELVMFRPTFIVAVPRIFEKVHRGASLKAAADGRQRIFDRATDVAVRWSKATRDGARPSPWLRVQHTLFDRLVYGRLRAAFGGQLQLAICGGAALDADLARFFDGIGITILQGYGLTEASPIVSGGPADPVDFDTVGRVYPATTVRLADDDEILIRGPQVFRGYWHAPGPTSETLHDGWLYTGDLGAITSAGDLAIIGRKKDIIVTAGGKNVVPGPLEDHIRTSPLVDQCVVVGEGRSFVGALLFLDAEELARRRGVGEPVEPAALAPELDTVIAEANATVSRGEAIRSYRVLSTTLTIEADEITPTLKLRRPIIEERYGDEIDALYR